MTTNTPRRRMSRERRHHIFTENCTAHNIAPCCLCERPIHRTKDRWIIEHKRALALLGKDTNPNCGPAHYDCAMVKTHTEDLPRIRKAKRQQAAATAKYHVHDTHLTHDALGEPEGMGIIAAPPAKKSSRGLRKPAGAVFDWKRGRYVAAPAV